MTIYSDEEMLQLSGIQHYVLCPRQWALIHLDCYWNENELTTEGKLLHHNVDNPFFRETNGSDTITLRGLRLSSPVLGLSGIADAVEIFPLSSIPISKSQLLASHSFRALPIEYKRGKPKINDCDRVQVTAQAMILEEMWGIYIPQGAIFYWEERHREYFDITSDLREKVRLFANEMHSIRADGRLPQAIKQGACRSCSLKERCQPAISSKSAAKYIKDIVSSLTSCP